MFTSTQTTTTSTPTPTRTHRTRISPFPTSPLRTTTRESDADPFRSRFGHELPPGLREQARGMSWRTFTSTFAPTASLRIHHIESTRLRAGKFRYTATLTHSANGEHRRVDTEIIATGPVSACTNLLADAGRRVEILEFHQFDIFEATVIFIRTCENNKQAWSMGFGATTELAAAHALSAAAELLHG